MTDSTLEQNSTGQAQDNRLAFANEVLNPIKPYGALDALREMSRRLILTSAGKHGLTVMEAVHVAQMAFATLANPFNGEIQHWIQVKNNKRYLTVYWGRPYWVRLANEWAAEHDTTFMPPEFEKILKVEEKESMGATADDYVYRCRVRDEASTEFYVRQLTALIGAGYDKEEAEKIVGKPPMLTGIGIVTQQEIKYKNFGAGEYPHDERAMKRSYTNALKKKVTFKTPEYRDAGDLKGYIKEDWNPKSASNPDVIEAIFSEGEVTTDVDQNIPQGDDFFAELEQAWRQAQETESPQWSKTEIARRQKVGAWTEEFCKAAVAQGIADNPYKVAAYLAWSPFHVKQKYGKTDQGQMLEWLRAFITIRENAAYRPTMPDNADYASKIYFGMVNSFDEIYAEIEAESEGGA